MKILIFVSVQLITEQNRNSSRKGKCTYLEQRRQSAVSINFKYGLGKQWLAKDDNHNFYFMHVQSIMTRMYFTKKDNNHNCYLSKKTV
uniref:Uncharacterized protein n=1 Tax=Setaria italica TaxID=4555 RepID=K4AHB2_SETIT